MAADEDFTSTTLQTGSKASIGTTAAAICGTITKKPRQGVLIKALATNAVTVYIGISTVTAGVAAATTDGYPLAANEEVFIFCDNPGVIYGITASSTATVHFLIN